MHIEDLSVGYFLNPRRKSIFSDLEKKAVIFSMAYLGYLKDIRPGEVNPYFRGRAKDRMKEGEVEVPSEFSKLLPLLGVYDNVVVYFSDDSASLSRRRDWAFKLNVHIAGAPYVEILYGLVSGVVGIRVHGDNTYDCRVPDGFSIDDLVTVLSDDTSFENFVIDNAKLSPQQIRLIKEKGLV